MLRFKTLTIKNFMSVGNNTQVINLDTELLTLIVGHNADTTNSGSRNGVGKTTILNALSYALYGRGISNIKKDNLINKFNGKDMLVTLDFTANGLDYRIERGRKPNVICWFVNNGEVKPADVSEGESKWTNKEIEKIVKLSFDLFQHILGMNTETDAFLKLGIGAQRSLIEELFGITTLTTKADLLRDAIKTTKDSFREEELRLNARKESNANIQKTIETIKLKSKQFTKTNDDKITTLTGQLSQLAHIDIDVEIKAHKWKEQTTELNGLIAQVDKEIRRNQKTIDNLTKRVSEFLTEAAQAESAVCPACEQNLPEHVHAGIVSGINLKMDEHQKELEQVLAEQEELELSLNSLNTELVDLGQLSDPFYSTIEDAYNHKAITDAAMSQLQEALDATNPYEEQIETIEQTGLQEINYDRINELNRYREHQEFLLKLLTDKGSFIRKKIIDQNLVLLNARLTLFLEKVSMPHRVIFRNDLSVDILKSGLEYDFENLSRGERTRTVLAMCWAFRDVYETIHHPMNLLFVDELADSGIDPHGALMIHNALTEMQPKSIYLITHREELIAKAEHILLATKSNEFTTFGNSNDIQD